MALCTCLRPPFIFISWLLGLSSGTENVRGSGLKTLPAVALTKAHFCSLILIHRNYIKVIQRAAPIFLDLRNVLSGHSSKISCQGSSFPQLRNTNTSPPLCLFTQQTSQELQAARSQLSAFRPIPAHNRGSTLGRLGSTVTPPKRQAVPHFAQALSRFVQPREISSVC